MRLGIDVEIERVAFLAPGRAGLEFAAVSHDHIDHVVFRMNVLFHGVNSLEARALAPENCKFKGFGRRLYRRGLPLASAAAWPLHRAGTLVYSIGPKSA